MKKNKNIKIIMNFFFISTFILADSNADWAKDAIWYQILPDRFYNGDITNDPTIESLWGVWPWERQNQWEISPWTSDWYELQPWEKANGQDFAYQFQMRRYGGDIQGIINKLDYLEDLGINAIYLNPVFDSPSSHKYGTAMYHHIDRHFGPDPLGDTQIINSENPADPNTWQWTAADKLFLQLIDEVHERNMHIIIDGVFNHVGLTFWAFQGVIQNRENSEYYEWFNVEGNKLPDRSHLNEYKDLPEAFIPNCGAPMRYTGYVEDLPAFRQDQFGPVEPVRNHLHEIVKRWMDPNRDGDPSDGIDGWRLDVAERLQINFWDIFGKWVREINPNAYITGEVWWENYWNNKQFDASQWLATGRFDAVMNYRFGDAMFNFFINKKHQIKPSELQLLLDSFINDYGEEKALYLQSILDSHDMERLASAVVNPDRWMDHGNNLKWNQEFDISKPNLKERNIQKTMIAFQFA
ncbi:MAG: alpha-amylase, partial [Candidatus Marinimicrobia bacterium]|nr:alpha-amylase [Candidatus Neomarinimicrobiota bacterium]